VTDPQLGGGDGDCFLRVEHACPKRQMENVARTPLFLGANFCAGREMYTTIL
jgi:hypothetical protein